MKISWKAIWVPLIWTIIILLNINQFFFWDTIQLASKHAHFFYENNFSQFFLPEGINSGHPPFFGMLLAFLWKIFGQHLYVGHVLMLLFVLGSIYQATRIGEFLVGKGKSFLFPLILFCNPIFLGHSVLVSPDNIFLFLILMAFNAVLKSKSSSLVISTLLLSMVSLRGMMAVLAIFIGQQLFLKVRDGHFNFRWIICYLPSGVLALTFLLIHNYYNDWIGFHEESPWEESFNPVSLKGYFYNLGLIAWRLLDFGNVFVLIPVLLFIYQLRTKLREEKFAFFIAFLISFSMVLILPLAGFKYLTGHRYFMPLYALVSFFFIIGILELEWKRLGMALMIALFMGNWWIYPRTVSQGWDVSLGHSAFYGLNRKMQAFIDLNKINPKLIGTEFPLKSEAKYLYLDDQYSEFHEANLERDKFILYSRVMNDFKEKEYQYLQEHFYIIQKFSRMGIDLILYERR